MEYLRTEGDFPILKDSIVMLGKFDGLHRGHQKLIQAAVRGKTELLPAVMAAFCLSDQFLFSREERRAVAAQMGVDYLIECPLTEKLRHMSPEDFVFHILVEKLHASRVLIGDDYRFGYQRSGDSERMKELGKGFGFETEVIKSEMESGQKISSSLIRRELGRGRLERVNALLGMPFFLDGTVIHGRGLGHRELLPTANLRPPEEKLMPPYGVYATVSRFDNVSYQGISNVGFKPTVEGDFLGVETYLYDCSEDLYGKSCRVEFHHFLRPEQKFDTLPELKQQLLKDVEAGRRYFADNSRPYEC